jgi:hypothetical protein
MVDFSKAHAEWCRATAEVESDHSGISLEMEHKLFMKLEMAEEAAIQARALSVHDIMWKLDRLELCLSEYCEPNEYVWTLLGNLRADIRVMNMRDGHYVEKILIEQREQREAQFSNATHSWPQ